jgi:hypothetical protein
MPDLMIIGTEGPSTLYAALRRGRHVLVVSDCAADSVDRDEYADVVDIVTAPWGRRRALALIRPDGYLAAVATADDPTSIHEYLERQAPVAGQVTHALQPGKR